MRVVLLHAVVILACVAVSALALSRDARVEVEAAEPPREYRSRGRTTGEEAIELIFALKRDESALSAALHAIADVDSPRWGKFLSRDEADALSAPPRAHVDAVKRYIALFVDGARIDEVARGGWLRVTTSVRAAELMLAAEYELFDHVSGDPERSGLARTRRYTLPATLSPLVEFVGPTVRFPRRLAVRASAAGTVGATPESVRALYNVGDAVGESSDSSLMVAQFLGQYFAPSDLATFFDKFAPLSVGTEPRVVGPNVAANPGDEASLDIQWVMAMGAKVPTTFQYTPGQQPNNTQNEPFLVWLLNITADGMPPHVISVSYGDNEESAPGAGGSVSLPYARSCNIEFQALGTLGTSVMFSSGDGGVAGSQTSACHGQFIPTFPAASPYVTAVGGTGPSGGAASFSSGGFSNYWTMPDWQTDAVANYIHAAGHTLPTASMWNHTGAGFPDVAALAEGFSIVLGGHVTSVDGTSCSSPTFSGILSLIVDMRLMAGKGPLGWLNVNLYSQPSWQAMLTDITAGSNPGCDTQGFYATDGWDPVTGWGTPDFTKMVQVLVNETP